MKNLKLTSFVIFVDNIEISKNFYTNILGQEIEMDFGVNIGFKGGLGLWQKEYGQKVIFGSKCPPLEKKNEMEIYFETSDIEKMWDSIKSNNVKVIHEITTQPWQQRVFRFYDPDNFIVEIGESMQDVVKRLSKSGLTNQEIFEKTSMPINIVELILQAAD
jgi:predicted enzyme related to lactoylglutathione lyase